MEKINLVLWFSFYFLVFQIGFNVEANPKPYSESEMRDALRSGNWKAGCNLGVKFFKDNELEKAYMSFTDSAKIFLKLYDRNANNLIEKDEYKKIPTSDYQYYPTLFYNLGRMHIQREEWAEAARNLKISSECGVSSEARERARHDYSVLVAKKLIPVPDQFLNHGMTFQSKEEGNPKKLPFDYKSILKELISYKNLDISILATRNLNEGSGSDTKALREKIQLYLQNEKYEEEGFKIFNNYLRKRKDFKSAAELAKQIIRNDDLSFLKTLLFDFPNEDNYSMYIAYSRRANTAKSVHKKNNYRGKADDYKKKVDFEILDKNFRQILDTILVLPSSMAFLEKEVPKKPTATPQSSISFSKSHNSNEKSLLLQYLRENFQPPLNFEKCERVETFMEENNFFRGKLAGFAYFTLYEIYSRIPNKEKKSDLELKKRSLLERANSHQFPEAFWVNYKISTDTLNSHDETKFYQKFYDIISKVKIDQEFLDLKVAIGITDVREIFYFEAFIHLGRTALNLKKDKQRPRFFDFRSLYENSYYQMKQSNFFKDLIWSPNQNEWSYQIKLFKEYSEKILSDLTEQ